jgi:hypothetical protein
MQITSEEFERLNALYNQMVTAINDSDLDPENVRAVLARITVELFLNDYSVEEFVRAMAGVFMFERNFIPDQKEMH